MNKKIHILILLVLTFSGFATTITVTQTNGNASWDAPTANNGSFAGAILALNAAAGTGHTIAFNIPGAGPHIIDIGGMTAALSAKTGTTIDGYTQPSSVCNSDLRIAFDLNWTAFTIANQTTLTIKGIRFNSGLTLSACNGVLLQGCFFNLNNTGTAADGTVVGGAQLTIAGCLNTTIGGMAACEGNVFSGATASASSNYTNSIIINGTSTGLKLYKNYIGTNRAGTTRLGSLTGVVIDLSASQNVEIDGNVISASKGAPGHGINVTAGNCDGLLIKNNKIGLDVNGNGTDYSSATTFGNWGSGILIGAGSVNNMVIDNNDIGANKNYGIHFKTSHSGVQITNNNIGLRTSGVYSAANDVGNGYSGICFEAITSTNVTISNNLICRNGFFSGAPSDQKETCGLVFQQGTVASATISNNKIGVDQSNTPAGNEFTGLYFYSCSNMGGSNAANVMVSGNTIGDNGESTGTIINSHGIATYSSNYFTISGNYIGVGPSGENIGNSANGIEVNTSSNFIITGNQIANNKGRRTSAEAEACAGIVAYFSTNGTLYDNDVYNHANAGGSYIANNGIIVQRGGNIKIGGMSAGQPNSIFSNGTHGIAVFEGADFVEMRYNSIFCNASKGINIGCSGSVFGKTPGNNSFGCATLSISPTPPALPTSIGGNRPTNSIVDVFGTGSCAGGASCISQGEARFSTGTYTPSAQGVAGTTWTYNHGSAMYNDLSALATGGLTDCSGGICRTSEFSPCVDNPLPVRYISFDANGEGDQVAIRWTTSMESNSDFFILERSADGISFEPITRIAAAGTTEAISNYSFLDENPIQGTSYYRLKQVDIDGTIYQSDMRKVNLGTSRIMVFPNPSEGEFLVSAEQGASIEITSILGASILKTTAGSGATEFKNILAPGIYIVIVQTGSEKWSEKLIIE